MNARVLGALQGLATGDAIGKQTETLSHQAVLRWYPHGVRGFEGPPGTVIPRYAGNRKREWLIGETTDDTEQTIAVCRAILRDAAVRHESVGRELLSCRKSVHPGVRSFWEFHSAGDPARVTPHHNGCGAAMRVSPVGMIYSSARRKDIIVGAREASIPTHGGPLALAASAAAAAAVSMAIDGGTADDIVDVAEWAAATAECERSGSRSSLFAQALRTRHDDFRRCRVVTAETAAASCFPDDSLRIVPLAIAIATVMDAAEAGILVAANIGGDSDSVASIAGAILGARAPETVNGDWLSIVEMVNDHRLSQLAEELSALRR